MKTKTNKKENEKLNISNKKNSLYCNSKIMCESFYQKKCFDIKTWYLNW